MKRTANILHLTDLHLFSDQSTKLVGINPSQSLQQVVNKVLNESPQKKPDLIILTGDISQDFSLASYEIAIKILKQLPCPMVSTMGNHDLLSTFTKIFGNPTQMVTQISDITNWRIILLNSHWSDHVDGHLLENDLTFLQKNLEADTSQPIIIFLHHHVLPVASNWLDKIKLQNSTQFLEIITKYKNVKAVVCGHIHQETSITYQDVIFLSTPATSWQFTIKSNNFKLDPIMPGYRWINLYEDGTIQTEVVRIDYDKTLLPDISSKGY